ncbi:uncharacterized protein LOC131045794 isoform X2 [Cryptomeria japonica]|uniref:uncharacterized protein LOC131045794 isoform X2 n=1 Tax=Cryptomeria japonica TaxID=3369 RepID=UPI0027D9F7AA|nr:uncharacterized protein LOC131045794 isoform X2 [Cryptomeria japonica]
MAFFHLAKTIQEMKRTHHLICLLRHFSAFTSERSRHPGLCMEGLECKSAIRSMRSLTSHVGRTHGIWDWMNILNCRCSTVSDKLNAACSGLDLLTLFESTLDTLEGPSHRWLNMESNKLKAWDTGGIFLAAINVLCQNDMIGRHEKYNVIDKLKFIKQRFPNLQVLCIQHGFSYGFPRDDNPINNIILKEYITFPVLVSSLDFSKVVNGAFFLLFEGFKNPISYCLDNMDIETMLSDIEAFQGRRILGNGASEPIVNSSVELGLPDNSCEFVKEPVLCDISKDFVLLFPGAVSADEDRQHIFVSDSNHHRIIVANANGRILDCIGSSPGFEDGPFETAKLCRPASSIFRADQDCLYFADAENHAIRMADMEKRTVQTLYPSSDISQGNTIWRFINRLMQRLHFKKIDDDGSEEMQLNALKFPWHLALTQDNNLVITNRGFGDLWTLNLETGEIKERSEGVHSVVELFREKATSKMEIADEVVEVLISKDMPQLGFVQDFSALDIVSSLAKLQDVIVLVDTDGQRILKVKLETGDIGPIQLSNFGCLGLPYWYPYAMEQISNCRNTADKNTSGSHRQGSLQRFHVKPGRCELGVNLILPRGTKLAASLDKGCIWRQSRGSVVELSMYDGLLVADKVGMEQQFYDELESVLLDPDISEEVGEVERGDQESHSLGTFIYSSVDVSHGVGEIMIDAVVYLTLDKSRCTTGNSTTDTHKLIDFQDKDKSVGKEMCMSLLSEVCKGKEDVFMKHAHIQVRLKCSDDAPAERKLSINFEL